MCIKSNHATSPPTSSALRLPLSLKKMHKQTYLLTPLHVFCFFCSVSSLEVTFAGAGESSDLTNPFTPRGFLLRYWNRETRSDSTLPEFLLSKASPLNAVESASFTKLANQNALQTRLPEFCSGAQLLCFPDLSQSLEKHELDSKFASYTNKNFTNYGTSRPGGLDSFKSYSDSENIPLDSFRRYSRDAAGHNDSFVSYATDANVADQSFNSYAAGATGGAGDFKGYNREVNVPNLRFDSYAANGDGRKHSFSSYTEQTNSGSESFSSYGKDGNGDPSDFTSYAEGSNVMSSSFSGYGEMANGATGAFKSYGDNGNVPQNKFNNYGARGNNAEHSFTSYRFQANVGEDSFRSYAKSSNAETVKFAKYGRSFNEGTDKFIGYGKDASGASIGFEIYGRNNTFKDYSKKDGISFLNYANSSSQKNAAMAAGVKPSNPWVEPGKFFREEMLKKGMMMPMPNIRDKMPKRSFLPRSIASKLPFSTSKLAEMKRIFHASDGSSLEKMMIDALADCERLPSPGETKRCAVSAEDMIDFSTSVLGRSVVVRTTENVNGSGQNIKIGAVSGINGGKVTKSVSCHQSLFPYLLYYCHSVPKVRVYEADMLDPSSESKINRGVAICHLDTSAWSSGHAAFSALGGGPGRIEVCHWIFENDMTWTIAD